MTRVVVTEKRHPEDLPDEFYFSTAERWGGGAAVGDDVVIESRSGSILGRGRIVKEGKPYEECKTVQVVQRFG